MAGDDVARGVDQGHAPAAILARGMVGRVQIVQRIDGDEVLRAAAQLRIEIDRIHQPVHQALLHRAAGIEVAAIDEVLHVTLGETARARHGLDPGVEDRVHVDFDLLARGIARSLAGPGFRSRLVRSNRHEISLYSNFVEKSLEVGHLGLKAQDE